MQPVGVLETAKATNPLKELLKFGQSVWLDYIRRDLLTGGELKRLIDEDGLRGMTSNPTIFEKAITGGKLYDDLLNSLRPRTDLDAKGRLRSPRHPRHPGCRRYVPAGVRKHQAARRLCQHRSIALSRPRHEGLARRSAPAVEVGRSRECDGQDSRHRRGSPCHPAGHQRRHQHQYHPALRAGRVRESRGSLHRRPGAIRQKRRRRQQDGQRGQLLHQPH